MLLNRSRICQNMSRNLHSFYILLTPKLCAKNCKEITFKALSIINFWVKFQDRHRIILLPLFARCPLFLSLLHILFRHFPSHLYNRPPCIQWHFLWTLLRPETYVLKWSNLKKVNFFCLFLLKILSIINVY